MYVKARCRQGDSELGVQQGRTHDTVEAVMAGGDLPGAGSQNPDGKQVDQQSLCAYREDLIASVLRRPLDACPDQDQLTHETTKNTMRSCVS